MEVKEAIEFCEKGLLQSLYPRRAGKNSIKQIISLLQQGEAYRQMWERLCKKLFEPHFNYTWSCNAFEIMEEIEQKYFPK